MPLPAAPTSHGDQGPGTDDDARGGRPDTLDARSHILQGRRLDEENTP
ncbi:hypothetical protein [Brachybacterium sacelli]